ncbi:diguanylate cyclase domain-containing protein [Micromonosporaceae bacterium Da 78-11]
MLGRILGSAAFLVGCVALHHYGWLGTAPLPVMLILTMLTLLLRVEWFNTLLSSGDPHRGLWLRMGVNYLLVLTPTLALSGWGPVAGPAFLITTSIYLGWCGSRAWNPAVTYTVIGILLTAASELTGLIDGYVSREVTVVVTFMALTAFTRVTVQLGRSADGYERSEAELLESQRQARRGERWFRALVQNIGDVISVIDRKGIVSYVSPSVQRQLGFTREEVLGRSSTAAIDPRDTLAEQDLFARLMAEPDTDHRTELRFVGKDGASNWHEVIARNMLADPDIAGIVINHRNIHERRTLQEGLAYEASHDPLTGLANRAELFRLLGDALIVQAADVAAGTEPATVIAALFIDLDGFKPINDKYGHAAGDALLIVVSRLLERCVLGADAVARVGGDEFVVMLREIRRPDDPESVARRILGHLQAPLLLPGFGEVRVGASIGIAVTGPASTAADLIRDADHAMYEAKRAGRNQFAVAP